MKKIIAVLTVATLSLGLVACSAQEPKTTSTPDATPQTSAVTPSATPTATPSATPKAITGNYLIDQSDSVTDITVKSGGGEVIGQRVVLVADKSEVQKMSSEQFKEFANQTVAEQDRLNKNWFTVKFKDGTGIIFVGCDTITCEYGELDNEGRIKKLKETIVLSKSFDLSKILK